MTAGYSVVAIGLGSNLADPAAQLRAALAALAQLPATALVASSSFYRSRPMGPQDQPDYVNAAAVLHTQLQPLELLDALQAIEQRHGRDRSGVRWGARPLDLDLLLWDERRIAHPRLTVPHPGLHERAFVLYPLAEIGAAMQVPGRGTVAALRAACPAAGLIGSEPAAAGMGGHSG